MSSGIFCGKIGRLAGLPPAGVALANQIQEGTVDAWVVAEFGMKRRRHGLTLADHHGVAAFRSYDLHPGADLFDLGRADEDHL